MANDLSAFVPEIWAAESLMVLNANLVMANLVHRDFSKEVAQAGDAVNTRKPGKFYGVRKSSTDNVQDQDATAENVQVKLDHHLHVSFIIHDGDESKGMVSLRDTYLVPAIVAIAQSIDAALLGEKYNFLANCVGQLGTDPTVTTVVDANTKLNELLAPVEGRNLIVSPNAAGKLQAISTFHEANKVGDDGTALRYGSLGMKFGLSIFMSQNCPTVNATDITTGSVSNSGGYAAGTTSVVTDLTTATVGSWVTFAGDMIPQLITANATGTLTIYPGLSKAIVNGAVATNYQPAACNQGTSPTGYASAYDKPITIDRSGSALTTAPKVGQLISKGTSSATLETYGSVQTISSTGASVPNTTTVSLNRSLDSALADNAVVGLGPAGDYGFAFHRNAIALVSRPLATPAAGTGAMSAVVDANGIAVRVTITYDGKAQGHRVTIDVLCGVKTLDTDLGAVVLS